MEYQVEEISPVKKKINISVTPDEATVAIDNAAVAAAKSAQIPGFRRGKAPRSVVEKRFHDSIRREARENLINAHITDILREIEATPVSEINAGDDGQQLERGKPYSFSLEFEVLPDFELPAYEGLEVEEERLAKGEEYLEMAIERLRREYATLNTLDETAPAKEGQIANIDFEAFDMEGAEPKIKQTDFNLPIGREGILPDFENLVKSIPVGHTAEGIVTFPDDFFEKSIAGETIRMRVTVRAVKELILPELDDALARQAGFESVAELKDSLQNGFTKMAKDLTKAAAQRKLLDKLLQMTDYPIPPAMVAPELGILLADLAARLERSGKSLESTGKTLDEIVEELRPRAESRARDAVILRKIAEKENLSVSDDELRRELYRDAVREGIDYKTFAENMKRTGMIAKFHNDMLADKAMDLIYEKANVTLVDHEVLEQRAEDANISEKRDEAPVAEKQEEVSTTAEN